MKKKSFFEKAKAKLGQYRKILVPFIRVLLNRTVHKQSTAFVLSLAKKEQRKFFKAKIYTLHQFVRRVGEASDEDLAKDDLRELVETFPLLALNIGMTNERWYIGKIEDEPFDIFMAPERFVEVDKEAKTVQIYRGLHIQTKRLYQHPPKRLTLEEWVTFVGSVFEEKIARVDYGFNGHIHFYNQIPLTESVDIKKLKKLFRNLYIPYNKYVDSISVSMELLSATGEATVVTWYIYPMIFDFAGVLDLDFDKIKKVYIEADIAQMMIKALKQKIMMTRGS